jgi:TIR domain
MRCTAPVQGHRSSAAAANCPACRGGYGRRSYYSPPVYRPSYSGGGGGGGGGSSSGGSTRSTRSTRSGRVSGVAYTDAEWRAVEPAYEKAEEQARTHPDRRDVFLCHAWADREGAAKQLHDLLEARGVKVWFSEKDVVLGTSLLRAIDRGLKNSRIGIVLATPALLKSLAAEGIADKELAALLATERVIPVAHETTMNDVRDESPLLGSRAGLTSDGSLDDIAAKIADAVAI